MTIPARKAKAHVEDQIEAMKSSPYRIVLGDKARRAAAYKRMMKRRKK